LRQGAPNFGPPPGPAPAPPQHSAPPDRKAGRRAKRRARKEAAAGPNSAHTTGEAPTIGEGLPIGEPQHAAPDVPVKPPVRARPDVPAKADVPDEPRAKKPKMVSQRGWRHWVHTLTRINLGLSRDEKYELDLRTRIRRSPRGGYQIGVVGLKGGAGKTTLTAVLGSMLAQVRGDRILAVDADPGCGNLADRTGRSSSASIADLLTDKELSHYNDVRTYTSVNSFNLEVLPASEYTTAQRGLSGQDWHFAADSVSKFYNLVLADCGAGLFDPVTRGMLSTASGVVIAASASIDSVRQATIALDWLRNNGHQDLRNRACVVINQVAPEEPNIPVQDLLRRFEQQVQPGRVVVLPFDKHIAAGTEIQLELLDRTYRRRLLELAAALSDDFEGAGRR
jgi:MinD-like ATPase involved in chromosome partitioning or flagellar assembly